MNADVEIKGDKVVVTIDLTKNQGPSASGKTIIIGTTGGNLEIKPGVYLGVNCYKKK